MMLVDGSMTGVLVMPISGLMSPELVSPLGMVVTEVAPGRASLELVVSRNVRCQRICAGGGVDGVQRVVLGGDKNDRIVGAGGPNCVRAGRNGDIGQNEGLGIDLAVHWGVVQLAEIGGVDVRRCQLRLGQVGPG